MTAFTQTNINVIISLKTIITVCDVVWNNINNTKHSITTVGKVSVLTKHCTQFSNDSHCRRPCIPVLR